MDGHTGAKIARFMFRRLPREPRCKACHSPFRGVGGAIARSLGFKPSRKNPSFCVRCCEKLPRGGTETDVAIVFADVSGSTRIAEGMGSSEYAALLDRFYRAVTRELVRHDAIIDKFIGDEVMALFVPGLAGREYRRRAVDCAVELLRAVGHGSKDGPWLPVKVGVHAGTAYVGNVGADTAVDMTALGDAVNVAARLRSAAEPGQIVASEEIYRDAADRYPEVERRTLEVRGREQPLAVRVFRK